MEAIVQRGKRAPRRFEVDISEGSSRKSIEHHYRRQYYEALDCASNGITDRFGRPGYTVYKHLEGLGQLLSALT